MKIPTNGIIRVSFWVIHLCSLYGTKYASVPLLYWPCMCLEQNCHSSSLTTIFTSCLTIKNFGIILPYWKSGKYDVLFYKSYMPWHSFPAKIPIIVLFFMVQQPLMGQGLLIIEASWLQSNTPHSSRQVIILTQIPLPDNRQHSLQTHIHALAGFEPPVTASERRQTQALDCTTTGISPHHSSNFYSPIWWRYSL